MKKYFNGKGTITGWQAILRGIVPSVVLNVLVNPALALYLGDGIHQISPWIGVPAIIGFIVASAWLILSTIKKRLQSYGWTGGWLGVIFPNFADASYPNGKQSED